MNTESLEEKIEIADLACNHVSVPYVLKHKLEVQINIQKIIDVLLKRAEEHDNSKLEEPELSIFDDNIEKLKKLTYGSDEYKKALEEIKPALDHHYAKNYHHPEKYPDGINGMTLIDLIEMFCDWYAATKKHSDGNLERSIKVNAERFKMSKQLVEIFENTRQSLQWQ